MGFYLYIRISWQYSCHLHPSMRSEYTQEEFNMFHLEFGHRKSYNGLFLPLGHPQKGSIRVDLWFIYMQATGQLFEGLMSIADFVTRKKAFITRSCI